MKTILKQDKTKRYITLMKQAQKNSDKFLTGNPLKISRYGIYPDGKTSFVTFITEQGIEETYKGECLAAAVSDSEKIIEFKLD